jgi:hypothetical protein
MAMPPHPVGIALCGPYLRPVAEKRERLKKKEKAFALSLFRQ